MTEIKSIQDPKPYKFRELKVYSSTEWLAENKKRYRQVYDRQDTSFVYAELSLYNRLFDREEWEAEANLKCYSLKGNKEVCSLDLHMIVPKTDHFVYVREGWGNKKEGTFWKKGAYYWVAHINGEKLGTKYFYIEESSSPQDPEGLFVVLDSFRLYEGQYDDVGEDDRTFYRCFSAEETRYIYAEVDLHNLNILDKWQCELFVKFYNEARELKGQVVRMQTVNKGDKQIKITAGWGSNIKGSWREGLYSAELIFMERLLGVIYFEVDEQFEEGVLPVHMPDHPAPIFLQEDDLRHLTFEDVLGELNALIGLADIKKQVFEHSQYIKFLQLRKDRGFQERDDISIHSVFIGNPGTGKTTVARMMGKLYQKMGLLTKGHIHEVDRVDLIGEYIGQTAPKVKEAIEKSRGGVLFIDEAYSLARSQEDTKDFGREVIEILMKEMSNGPGDLAVIVAGYPREMRNFLDSNPGLKSRFKLYYEFNDYLPQELMQIADYACHEMEVTLVDEARTRVGQMITEAYRNRDRAFGNARFVHGIIEKGKINLALRVMRQEKPAALEDEILRTITMADIEAIDLTLRRAQPAIPVDEALLVSSLAELDALIGMKKIKEQILELVALVKFYGQTGKSVLNKFYLHTIFVGNPGTGKTTVARILTKIYKALGILERGHMVETDRQGLVAGYIGQTAIKTAEKIDEAVGGVLFIDEAYALTAGAHPSDYGNEVIQTILKRMEDQRGLFFVFAAGYPDNMEAFMKANPGLSSRFDKILRFEDYAPEELSEIAVKMYHDEGLKVSPKAIEYLNTYFKHIFTYRDKFFGNARAVRNIVTESIKNQNLRLAAQHDKLGSRTNTNVITFEDVKTFTMDKGAFEFSRKAIGFGR